MHRDSELLELFSSKLVIARECQNWGSSLLYCYSVLVEEEQNERCVKQISQNQVPEGVVVVDHCEPEEEACNAATT